MTTTLEPTVPYSDGIESSFLSCLLYQGDLFTQFADMSEATFYNQRHRAIWKAMRYSFAKHQIVTTAFVLQELELMDPDQGKPEDNEVVDMMRQAAGNGDVVAEYVNAYHAELTDVAARRQLNALSRKVTQLTVAGNVPTNDIINQLIADAVRIGSSTKSQGRWQSYSEVLQDAQAEAEARRRGEVFAFATGLAEIDRAIGGFELGTLNYIVGRPASGKSALGLLFARNIAEFIRIHNLGGCVGLITMEMSAKRMATRLVAGSLRPNRVEDPYPLNTRSVSNGFKRPDGSEDTKAYNFWMTGNHYEELHAGHHLFWYDHVLSSEGIMAAASQLHRDEGLKVLIIDQMDLVADPRKTGEVDRITGISRSLMQLARNLNITIICVAQLNRDSTKRLDKIPTLEDLAGSDALSRDGSTILGVTRYEKFFPYDPATDPIWYPQLGFINVIKNREGESGSIMPVRYIDTATKFESWPRQWDHFLEKPQGGGDSPLDLLLAQKVKVKVA